MHRIIQKPRLGLVELGPRVLISRAELSSIFRN